MKPRYKLSGKSFPTTYGRKGIFKALDTGGLKVFWIINGCAYEMVPA